MEKKELREYAKEIGLGALGFALPTPPLLEGQVLEKRREEGLLSPLVHHNHQKLCQPSQIMPGLASILVVLLPYYHPYPPREENGVKGRVSRYAWGLDYHRVMQEYLLQLIEYMKERSPSATFKSFVDTGPLLEKALAVRAGLGWWGKNTLLLTKEWGPWVFIGEILTDLEFAPDRPLDLDCGTCNRCIEACPTEALRPYLLNPHQCISHATMWGDEVPQSMQESIGDRIWGCDICQEVCPSAKKREGIEAFSPEMGIGPYPDLSWILSLTDDAFKKELGRTAMGWKGLKRLQHNARVALSNRKEG